MKGINCEELFQAIPDQLFQDLEEETKVNHQAKRLTGKLMFQLILFSLLSSDRISLRVMEDLFHTQKFQTFSGEITRRRTHHSSFAARLAHMDFTFFQKIFEYLKEQFKGVFKSKAIKNKIDIVKVDSTLVAISSELIDFGIKGLASNKSNKNQIKQTFCMRNGLPDFVETFTDQSSQSEEVALRKTILDGLYDTKSIVVFDRGLQRRKTFAEFSDNKIQFITRLKTRVRAKKIRTFKEIAGRTTGTLQLIADEIVYFKDEHGKYLRKEFRMITAKSLDTGEELKFLTNIIELNAREITDIYKERWSIEVLFRFLKQELNFKHLVSRSLNGIKVMLYMTLITSLLLLVYKHKNKITSYKHTKIRFALELEMEIIKHIVILCDGDISKLSHLKNPVPT